MFTAGDKCVCVLRPPSSFLPLLSAEGGRRCRMRVCRATGRRQRAAVKTRRLPDMLSAVSFRGAPAAQPGDDAAAPLFYVLFKCCLLLIL